MTSENDNESAPPKAVHPPNRFDARESGFSGANEDEDALRMRLALLLQEHSDLDAAILALSNAPSHDTLTVARLKKKKLQLKDMIQKLRDQLTPDIIA